MSCCSDFSLHDFEHRGSGRAGDNAPSAWLAGSAALLPPYVLCFDFFLHEVGLRSSGRAGDNPPCVSSFGGIVRIIPDAHPSLAFGTGLRPSKFVPDEFVAALLPPYVLGTADQAMSGFRPLLFVGWADPGLDPGEAQRVGAKTLGFTRTAFGFSPTYGVPLNPTCGAESGIDTTCAGVAR